MRDLFAIAKFLVDYQPR